MGFGYYIGDVMFEEFFNVDDLNVFGMCEIDVFVVIGGVMDVDLNYVFGV